MRARRTLIVSRHKIFTREVFAAIPLWIELGASPGDVAAALGTTENSLRVMCSRHKVSLRPAGGFLRSVLAAEHWSVMRREAARRGLTVPQLVGDVMLAVIEDKLFVAVLGDCEDSAGTGDEEQKSCAARL